MKLNLAKRMLRTRSRSPRNDYEDCWIDNPKGYANVLKNNLPFFVLIPAVRDITDESRVSKTNPFGRLIYAVINAITQEKRDELKSVLKSVAQKLNRDGGEERLAEVCNIETKHPGHRGTRTLHASSGTKDGAPIIPKDSSCRRPSLFQYALFPLCGCC